MGHRSPKQSDVLPIPGMLPEPSPALSQAEADSEDTGVVPINPCILNMIRSEINNIQFDSTEDSNVKLDIEDLRNSNKLMNESIKQVEDSLNAEFRCFESNVMNAIEDLTRKLNSGEGTTRYNGFELEALAGKGNNHDNICKSLNMAMEDQDMTGLTQETLSGAIRIIPVAKGKAPEFSQPIASSSRSRMDNMQVLGMALAQNELSPFMDKLSDMMAVHMGKLSEQINRLASVPPLQGEEPADAGPLLGGDDIEGLVPPDVERGA